MSSKKQKKGLNEKVSQVKLGSWMGIPPRTYVPVGFLMALGLLAFFLFLYPGIKFYGSQVTINSMPSGAAVFVDEKLVGATPVKVNLSAGEHHIKFKLQGYGAEEFTRKVKGRLFFSLFFPKKQTYTQKLHVQIIYYLQLQFIEASKWYGLSPDPRFPRPRIIEDTAATLLAMWPEAKKDLGDTEEEDPNMNSLVTWMIATRDLMQDEEAWQEITQAWRALSQPNTDIKLPAVLEEALTHQSLANYLQSLEQKPYDIIQHRTPPILASESVSILGLRFQRAPGGIIEMGKEGEGLQFTPNKVFIEPFYYMQDYVTKADYERLTGKKLASEGNVATGLSFDEIWDMLYGLKTDGKNVWIMTEAQWEYLAQTRRIKPTYFEWTSTPYVMYRNLFHRGLADFPRPYWQTRDQVIRGQSVFSGELPVWYRMPYPGDQNSPYIAVRLVYFPPGDPYFIGYK